MVHSSMQPVAYTTDVRTENARLTANTIKDGVGGTDGLRPHELLEAALAACMNISARMAAEKAGCRIDAVTTRVRLNRHGAGAVTFECVVSFGEEVTGEHREAVLRTVEECPVRRTLSRPIEFRFNDTPAST